MGLESVFSPEVSTIAGSVISGLIGVNIMFIKWLNNKFDKLAVEIKTQNTSFTKQVDDHEDKDQVRHEENLYRFEKIAVALARLGSDNGTHN